jgi:hypothetical protein
MSVYNGLSLLPAARFVPIAPAPPVDSRLRSCFCRNPQNCTCSSRSPTRSLSTPDNQKGKEPSSTHNRLATLARAAAMLNSSPDQQYHTRVADRTTTSLNVPRAANDEIKVITSTLDHPPIIPPSGSSASMQGTFPIMPPMARVLSTSSSDCTCGFQCTCPGCPEHRGPENVPKGRGYNCGDCVDHAGGIELPLSSHVGGASGSSVVDQFFARGDALPFLPQNQSVRHDTDDQMRSAPTVDSDEERMESLSPESEDGQQGDSEQEREPADDRDVRAVRPSGRRPCCGHKSPS